MSSSPLSVLPPYAMPSALARRDARPALDPFAAPASLRVPYVPPDARLVAATAVIDAPDESALVSGARLDTPLRLPVVLHEPDVLPSIDQYLLEGTGDDGATTMAALFAPPDVVREPVAEAIPAAATEVDAAAAQAVVEADEEPWAIADASEALAELADGLRDRANAVETSAADASPEALEPWTDDERWMDIMPALQTPGGPDLAGETAWARAFAEPPAPMTPAPLPAGDTEAAAASLEAIARRLRAGDLDIPGYRGDRGDAAALAAALAALLGAGR